MELLDGVGLACGLLNTVNLTNEQKQLVEAIASKMNYQRRKRH